VWWTSMTDPCAFHHCVKRIILYIIRPWSTWWTNNRMSMSLCWLIIYMYTDRQVWPSDAVCVLRHWLAADAADDDADDDGVSETLCCVVAMATRCSSNDVIVHDHSLLIVYWRRDVAVTIGRLISCMIAQENNKLNNNIEYVESKRKLSSYVA